MKDFIDIPVSSILKESVTKIPKYCHKPYIVYRNSNHCNKKIRVNTYFYRIKFPFLGEKFLPEKMRLCVYYDRGLCDTFEEYNCLLIEYIEREAYGSWMDGAR